MCVILINRDIRLRRNKVVLNESHDKKTVKKKRPAQMK
jgi:hypothetical protein